MAVPVIAATSTSTQATSSTTISVNEPGTTISGDVVVILVCNDDSDHAADLWDNSTNKPTGFTLIDQAGRLGANNLDINCAAFYKVIDGGESWPITCTSGEAAAQCSIALRITGADNTTPLDGSGSPYEPNTTGTSAAITGYTTTQNDVLAMYVCAGDGGDTNPHAPDGSWTESVEEKTGTTGGCSISGGYLNMPTAGATGTVTVSITGSDGVCGLQFGIAPEAAGGGPWTIPVPPGGTPY